MEYYQISISPTGIFSIFLNFHFFNFFNFFSNFSDEFPLFLSHELIYHRDTSFSEEKNRGKKMRFESKSTFENSKKTENRE